MPSACVGASNPTVTCAVPNELTIHTDAGLPPPPPLSHTSLGCDCGAQVQDVGTQRRDSSGGGALLPLSTMPSALKPGGGTAAHAYAAPGARFDVAALVFEDAPDAPGLDFGERYHHCDAYRSFAGQHKRAKFPTSKAPISAIFHSFRLIFGRAIISRNGLEAWMLFPERARAEHSR